MLRLIVLLLLPCSALADVITFDPANGDFSCLSDPSAAPGFLQCAQAQWDESGFRSSGGYLTNRGDWEVNPFAEADTLRVTHQGGGLFNATSLDLEHFNICETYDPECLRDLPGAFVSGWLNGSQTLLSVITPTIEFDGQYRSRLNGTYHLGFEGIDELRVQFNPGAYRWFTGGVMVDNVTVPEPPAIALMLLGLALFGWRASRSSKP